MHRVYRKQIGKSDVRSLKIVARDFPTPNLGQHGTERETYWKIVSNLFIR